jgi:hypothetical protein
VLICARMPHAVVKANEFSPNGRGGRRSGKVRHAWTCEQGVPAYPSIFEPKHIARIVIKDSELAMSKNGKIMRSAEVLRHVRCRSADHSAYQVRAPPSTEQRLLLDVMDRKWALAACRCQ